MSTKIYDAYVMDNISAIQLNKLVRTLTKIYMDYVTSQSLADEWALILNDLTQDIVYNRVAHVNNKNMIIYYGSMYQDKKSLLKNTKLHYREAKQQLSRLTLMHTVIDLSRLINKYDSDIMAFSGGNASIVLYPDKNDIKFQVFGTDLCKVVSRIVNDGTITGFNIEQYKKELKHYHIREYHYQNQTDKPDHITGREWRSRKLAWDRIMPSGIPSKDGTVINIMNTESLYMNIENHIISGGILDYYIRTVERIKNIADRPYSKAKEILFDRYVSNYTDSQGFMCNGQLSYNEVATLRKEFEGKIADKEDIWYNEVISLTSKLRPYTLNYDSKEVKDLCITYKKGLELQNLLDDSLKKLKGSHIFIQ